MSLPDIYGVNDIARRLGKSPDWVARAARAGDLSGVKIGKDWRFTASDVLLYLERQRDPKRSPRQAAARRREGSA